MFIVKSNLKQNYIQAASPPDAEDGMKFMQEMIELSKSQSQEGTGMCSLFITWSLSQEGRDMHSLSITWSQSQESTGMCSLSTTWSQSQESTGMCSLSTT